MRIVIGRGRRREVISLPCASIVKRGSDDEQRKYTTAICGVLGVC